MSELLFKVIGNDIEGFDYHCFDIGEVVKKEGDLFTMDGYLVCMFVSRDGEEQALVMTDVEFYGEV